MQKTVQEIKEVQVIYDFDDTIVETNSEFEATNEQCAEIIVGEVSGTSEMVKEVLAFQRKLDVEMVRTHGFIPPRYLMSWQATYEHFVKEAGKDVSEEVNERIKETVQDLYIRQYKNIPGSVETMEQLKKEGYSMIILTAGQDEIQKRKVRESGAIAFVEDVIVYPRKTPETLKEVMALYPAKQYVMIGNSLKSDIHPALENDAWGFHFERQTWEADHHDIDRDHEKYVHISSPDQIPQKLKQILEVTRPVAV